MKNEKIIVSKNELEEIIKQLKKSKDASYEEVILALQDVIENGERFSPSTGFEERVKISFEIFKTVVRLYLKTKDFPIDFPDDF